ncbi:Hypothetical protein R9X50_00616500 [Acrodontium crateriforme]|uniref:Uncharacterized protein n=1 Tax=Acrodontium crateriforme TaxID=150365 RepID=A0AAQ3M9I8_9PEZI|nr:Hypothetical protein R9X50_00616500 [Acrodontium crateriforme]
MLASQNSNALVGQQQDGASAEFTSRVSPSEPLTTSVHKPGVNVGKDAKPEFSAQTLPAGSAPSNRTFQPAADSDFAPLPGGYKASESIGGATSGDVNVGLGRPMQGQTSNELRHDGERHRKNPGHGFDNKLTSS